MMALPEIQFLHENNFLCSFPISRKMHLFGQFSATFGSLVFPLERLLGFLSAISSLVHQHSNGSQIRTSNIPVAFLKDLLVVWKQTEVAREE
jgi:hypothetical protein